MTLVPSSGLAFWLVARQRPVFGQGWPASWQAAERSAGRRADGLACLDGQLGAGQLGAGRGRTCLEVQAYTHRLRYQGQSVFVAHASDNGFGQGLNVASASIATVGDSQDVHG